MLQPQGNNTNVTHPMFNTVTQKNTNVTPGKKQAAVTNMKSLGDFLQGYRYIFYFFGQFLTPFKFGVRSSGVGGQFLGGTGERLFCLIGCDCVVGASLEVAG